MKRYVAMFFTALLVISMAGSAWATAITLGDILSNPSAAKYTDSGAEAVGLTDTDGTSDDATVFLLLELAGYAGTSTVGIYGFSYDEEGNVVLDTNSLLEVFAGVDSAITSATLSFDLVTGTVTNLSTGAVAEIGTTFGFYLDTENGIFFTQTELNADGVDHALIFDTRDNTVGALFGSDVVIAFEDLYGGGDGDYNDLVLGVTDVAPVPEPATMLLLGTGLLGLAGFRRKKS